MQWVIFAIVSKISDFQDQTAYMRTYLSLCLDFDQAKPLLLASTGFIPALLLPKDDTEVQYLNSSCDKPLFLQEDPRS